MIYFELISEESINALEITEIIVDRMYRRIRTYWMRVHDRTVSPIIISNEVLCISHMPNYILQYAECQYPIYSKYIEKRIEAYQ